ncbi:MAG TPA: biotin synthase BioB [Nitrospinota bacterium]|nr:biotin synthase BioB [Nitrospinota bacterium]
MVLNPFVRDIGEKILREEPIEYKEALELISLGDEHLFDILFFSDKIRKKYKGNKVNLCSIVNAKSGRCAEDCAFCAQSAYFKTDIQEYPLLNQDDILNKAQNAKRIGAHEFSIVTSGKALKEDELERVTSFISTLKDSNSIIRCASLGMLSKEMALSLKEAGLQNYHHNLETSKSFFNNICTTHSYGENFETIKIAKEAGLYVCCGGIVGMGETKEQRIELAFALRELDVDSVPINFLNPIKETGLEKRPLMEPMEALKTIALFRFILPKKEIVICGGREVTLRDLQPMMFMAGASGILIGDYLTTKGRKPKEDLQMIKDLGLEI